MLDNSEKDAVICRVPRGSVLFSKIPIHLNFLGQMPCVCRGSDFLLRLVKNLIENRRWFMCSVSLLTRCTARWGAARRTCMVLPSNSAERRGTRTTGDAFTAQVKELSMVLGSL